MLPPAHGMEGGGARDSAPDIAYKGLDLPPAGGRPRDARATLPGEDDAPTRIHPGAIHPVDLNADVEFLPEPAAKISSGETQRPSAPRPRPPGPPPRPMSKPGSSGGDTFDMGSAADARTDHLELDIAPRPEPKGPRF